MNAYVEYIAVAFGIIYVLLAARGIIWCWPAGIISSALYIYVNIYHHLFQDGILQFYYVIAGFYGWWLWRKGEMKEEQNFVSYPLKENFIFILGGALLVPVFGFLFSKLGNSLSYFDSAVTIFSFIATYMTAKKILENWLFWIVIDVVASFMYFLKGLNATAALYLFFSLVAVYGYFEWRKKVSRGDAGTQRIQ